MKNDRTQALFEEYFFKLRISLLYNMEQMQQFLFDSPVYPLKLFESQEFGKFESYPKRWYIRTGLFVEPDGLRRNSKSTISFSRRQDDIEQKVVGTHRR